MDTKTFKKNIEEMSMMTYYYPQDPFLPEFDHRQFGQPGQSGQFGQPGHPGQMGQPGQPGQQFFPGFPGGSVNQRLDRLERQVNQLNRRVDRIERRLGIRDESDY
jgi:hypothetical protein